jgi:protein phosphatase
LAFDSESASHVGHKRGQNEDYFDTRSYSEGKLYLLADGMGGMAEGARASHEVVSDLMEFVGRELDSKTDLSSVDIWISLYQEAKRSLLRRLVGEGGTVEAGTTLVTLWVSGRVAVLANCGDSRGYLYREGMLRPLTRDHTLAHSLSQEYWVSGKEGGASPRSNKLTRYIGSGGNAKPDVQHLQFAPDDAILLCSDGLTNQLSDDSIRTIIRSYPPGQRAKALLDVALSTEARDNVSVLLVNVLARMD